MSKLRQFNVGMFLAAAVLSIIVSMPAVADVAPAAPATALGGRAEMSSVVVDKAGEKKLELMLFIHRAGAPIGAATVGVAR